MSISKERFDQISGTLPSGGKFYTSKAIGDMEIEMPDGIHGVGETEFDQLSAAFSQTVADASQEIDGLNVALTASISASVVENNMHGSAWTLLNNFSGTAGIRTAINAANPTWITQMDAYVPWASGTANS